MTNEERFIASCARTGEAEVRQKLSAGRYGEKRATWAAEWLEQADRGKSDATKAAEQGARVRMSKPSGGYSVSFLAVFALALLLAGALAFANFR